MLSTLKIGVFIVALTVLIFLGCNQAEPTVTETPKTTSSPDAPSYFSQGDIEFHEIIPVDDGIIMGKYQQEILKKYNEQQGVNDTEAPKSTWEDYLKEVFSWYEVGTIAHPTSYNGWSLALLDLACEGPCFSPNIYRFAWNKDTGDLVLLTKHSSELRPEYAIALFASTDEQLELKGLNLPPQIALPEGKGMIELGQKDKRYGILEEYEVAYTDPELGKIYFMMDGTSSGCFYVQSPDGSASRYDYNAGFFNSESPTEVTWADGTTTDLSENYSYTVGGCGIEGNCYSILDVSQENLEWIGKNNNGVDFYQVKNPSENAMENANATQEQVLLAQSYQTYRSMYEWKAKEEGYVLKTFEEYVALKPLLFWQDPFERWSSLSHNEVKPLAECGKPVIYLYPETPLDVQVEVKIDEFTKTEPAYSPQGWYVKAYPNGSLYNYADQKTYPYLFWEGKEDTGFSVDEGFMVKREELYSFLTKSLNQIGFTEQEHKDFMTFWIPKMLNEPEPYFFVSFLGTEEMNTIAPLTITPTPDRVHRVFMFYHPTYTPFSVAPQKLNPIHRSGFTVFEWGATSSRPWQP